VGRPGSPLTRLFAFNYEAPHGDWAENEHCVVFETVLEKPPRADPTYAHGERWVDEDTLRRDVAKDPGRFTPWCLLTLERLGLLPAQGGGKGAP
jgi:isopentenyldiphosphate isomerase